MRAGIETNTFRYVEGILHSYERYPRLISNRKEEIMHPYRETDSNIGGGSSGLISNETERMATKLVTDKRLMELERQFQAVNAALNRANEATRRIVELYYIKKPRLVTWEGVAQKVGYSSRQCRRIRDNFIGELAEELGLK